MVAASRITPEAIDFLMNRGSGIIYVTVEGGGLEKLQSPFMRSSSPLMSYICAAKMFLVEFSSKIFHTN
ncbi:hypothetical protein SOVF_056800 isoform B [Spinacia oleracea]|nr:hypothetical protein SOVF_056800 isoform B [Spinacia oleracea]